MKKNKKAQPQLENTAPAFPIVGIGASAGGLAAFEGFFSGFPKGRSTGMAFVLVQHLAPDHKSILVELIKGFTSMEVFEIEDGMQLRPDCVYVIPPARDLAVHHGTLRLLEPSAPRGLRLPIDFFFRSLAQDRSELSIAVVLSGTGSDGSIGVRAIKGEGGLVIAQSPQSTEFDGMPQSAIATGTVDFKLLPTDMAAQLLGFVAHRGPRLPTPQLPAVEHAFKKIFELLRAQTGHDFSLYKPSTVHRRIARRMAVHQVDTMERYLKYLQQTPTEVEALFRDLLIGVTSFFRDPEAFEALEHALPGLFADKKPGAVVRVWAAGCSTGEEAYSIAMLVMEHVERIKQHFTVQIFATDIDSRAINTARAGVYPPNIAVDLSADRLARFFTLEPDDQGFRIKKSIRDLLVFSEQDILRDPPFSKLDLLSCRNVLIYLGPELQKKLIPLFFYALRSTGLLLLGTSEGVGDFDTMFSSVDRKAKLYRRKHDGGSQLHRPRPPPQVTAEPAVPRKADVVAKLSARELIEQALLQQLARPSALVDAQGDILYLYGRAGMYLELPPGESGPNNILKMAREGLRPALSSALHRAAATRALVRCEGLRVRTNGPSTVVNLSVAPAQGAASSPAEPALYLVIFEEAPQTQTASVPASGASAEPPDARVTELQQELKLREEQLQAINEELESSTEELKSSNEEMQSVNEELQSTNEELETSKEELQSVNEELATVNTELQTKVIDLSQANSDMNNLLSGTGIGTVFVDRQLKILRFTPAASAITNLIATDIGRPVGHIVSNLVGYDRLVADAQEVLDTLRARELDVQTTAGRWYTLRIQPYRTINDVIEGVVMSFTDVTEVVRTREALRKVNEVLRLAVVVRDSHDAVTVHGLDGRTLAWNPGATRLYGWSEEEALRLTLSDRTPPEERGAELGKMTALIRGEIIEPYRTRRITKTGSMVEVTVVSTALIDESGDTYAIATTEHPGPRAQATPLSP